MDNAKALRVNLGLVRVCARMLDRFYAASAAFSFETATPHEKAQFDRMAAMHDSGLAS